MAAFIWFLVDLFPTLFPGGYLFYGNAPHVPYLEQYIDTIPLVAARWVLYLVTALFILPMMVTIILELVRWRINQRRASTPLPANNPDEEQVTRFDSHLKLQHYLIMIGVTLAGILGLAQAFPDWGVSRSLVEGLGLATTRQFHHYFAYIVDFAILYFFGYLIYKFFVKKEKLRAMLPAWKDFKDFFEMNLYIFGLKRAEPKYARYTFGQKIDFFIIVVGLPVLSLTGLSMHYTTISSHILGGVGIALAAVLHRSVAIFIAWFVLSVHLYYAHLAPGLFPVNTVILTGRMSKSRYRAMYPLDEERLGGKIGVP